MVDVSGQGVEWRIREYCEIIDGVNVRRNHRVILLEDVERVLCLMVLYLQLKSMLIIFLIMIYKNSVSRKYDPQNMSYDMVRIDHRQPILDNMSYDMVKFSTDGQKHGTASNILSMGGPF